MKATKKISLLEKLLQERYPVNVEECLNAEKAFSAWEALFHLKNLLQLPLEKYMQAVDKKAIANVGWVYENAFDDVKKNVPFSFVWAVKKTAKIN